MVFNDFVVVFNEKVGVGIYVVVMMGFVGIDVIKVVIIYKLFKVMLVG